VAQRLDPDDLLKKAAYITELVTSLARNRTEVVKKMWTWLERNVSDEEFRTFTYPMVPPDDMPGGVPT